MSSRSGRRVIPMSDSEGSESEVLHCPTCGSDHHGAYALLGHIYTNHWIVDEPPEGSV